MEGAQTQLSNPDISKKVLCYPNGKLITGHTKEFQKDPLGFMRKISSFGEVVKIRFGPFGNVYLISDPEMIQQVLVTKQKHFVKSKDYHAIKAVLGEGLLTSEKETHLRQRRLIQPVFKRSQITNYGHDMVAIASDYLAKWREGK